MLHKQNEANSAEIMPAKINKKCFTDASFWHQFMPIKFSYDNTLIIAATVL